MNLSEIYETFHNAVGKVQVSAYQHKKRRIIVVTKWIGIRPFTVRIEGKAGVQENVEKMRGMLNRAYPKGYD